MPDRIDRKNLLLDQFFSEQRKRNAQRYLQLRVIALVVWIAIDSIFGRAGRPDLADAVPYLAVYFAVALTLFVASIRLPIVIRYSWWATAVVDVPFCFGIQYAGLAKAPSSQEAAAFAVGIFGAIVVISLLSLKRETALATTGLAIVCEGILLDRGQTHPGAVAASCLVLATIGIAGTWILGQLQAAVRERMAAISELNEGLELQVAERTGELRRALADLGVTQVQLVHNEKMASLGRLSAGLAHEINNPMNAVANAMTPLAETISNLREHPGDAELLKDQDALLNVVRTGVDRTVGIVSRLSDFARSDEREQRDLHDVAALCEETLSLLQHELAGRIRIVRDFDSDSRVLCYRGAFGQLLMNLIGNTAHAISGEGTITLRTWRESGALHLSVADTGTGIAPEVLPKIFDPFFTTKDVGRGTGLGLSIAHGIVERHGGRIAVESAVGQWTKFTVTLPLRP